MICSVTPFTGIAGDMLLAALIDAGAPLDPIRAAIAATGLTGWELTARSVVEHGLRATRVHVEVHDTATERRAAEVLDLVARATPDPVAALAVAAVTAIAEVEGHLHGVDPGEVHLHELGGHDTVVDIVGTAAAVHALGVTEVVSGPLPLGRGQVRSAHGVLPCPAPATLGLLTGAAVTGTDLPGETVTPTGAALLRALGTRYDPVPPMTVRATGYGAGTRRLPDRPNVTVVTLGDPLRGDSPRDGTLRGDPSRGDGVEPVVVLETNLDDVTGETLGHTIAGVLRQGALDAWTTPAVMKKGRPAHVLHVLARPADADRLGELVLAETGSLGLRRADLTRTVLPRAFETVDVAGHPVRLKHGPHGAKPEHDDVADVAERLGVPLATVRARALGASAGPPTTGG
ncbi:nickel pincer cofactor biosynthesis protein LarC [Actinosynnema sp. NPDC053489]|uniref:nickel pincer cofactor biosynthesis protein LarC n=1 Tax=Actinosynnema sp. NPDC053489 TaxID=3363916 RepID=UPI0037C5AF44